METKTVTVHMSQLYQAAKNGINLYDVIALACMAHGIKIKKVTGRSVVVAEGNIHVSDCVDYIEIFWYRDKVDLH